MTLLKTVMPFCFGLTSIYFWAARFMFKCINCVFRKWRAVEPSSDELLYISATRAAELIRNRDITATDLLEAYIERITEVNGALNAMIMENFDEARAEAQRIDDFIDDFDDASGEYANLATEKPLLGVPFTVKNNVFVKDFPCISGVPARLHSKPCAADADMVRRLRDAGAILIGITNVPELALWWETSNRLFGVTRNPHDLRRTSGGSSGGECALLGAGATLIGLGNDVGGSLRIPAAFCGVFGLKPGPKIVPFKGVYPELLGGHADLMASAGPLCRYAEDLSPFLRALVGNDVANRVLKLNEPVVFRNVRIFYMDGINSLFVEPVQPVMLDAMRRVVKYFEKKYDKSTYRLDLILAHHALEMYITSFDESNTPKVTKVMANDEGEVNPITELLRHLVGQSLHTLPALFAALQVQLDVRTEAQRAFTNSKRDQLRRELIDLLGDDGILLFPAFPTTAPFVNQPLSTPFNFTYTGLWNALALPAISCPLGVEPHERLPLAVQAVAAPNAERLLIAFAEELEEGFGGWVMPNSRKRSY